jgi:hypothetical protein
MRCWRSPRRAPKPLRLPSRHPSPLPSGRVRCRCLRRLRRNRLPLARRRFQRRAHPRPSQRRCRPSSPPLRLRRSASDCRARAVCATSSRAARAASSSARRCTAGSMTDLPTSLQSVTETTGLAALFKPARVLQLSRGEVTAEGLRPVEFRHERVGGLDTAAFDWGRRVVAYAGREEAIAPARRTCCRCITSSCCCRRSGAAGHAHRHRAQTGGFPLRGAGRGSRDTAGGRAPGVAPEDAQRQRQHRIVDRTAKRAVCL